MEWKIVPIRKRDGKFSHYLAIQREVKDNELVHDPSEFQLPFGRE